MPIEGDFYHDVMSDMVRLDEKKNEELDTPMLAAVQQDNQIAEKGLPIKDIGLMHILGMDILPLHKIICAQGREESCKSSFFWVLARLWLAGGGVVYYLDYEQKRSAFVSRGYIGNPLAESDRVHFPYISNPNDSMVFIKKVVTKGAKQLAQNQPIRPILWGIDTLGVQVSNEYSKKLADGDTTPGYDMAKQVLNMQQAFQDIIGRYLGWFPMTFYLVQQERKNLSTGHYEAKGGDFTKFQKSLALRFRRTQYSADMGRSMPIIEISHSKQSNNFKRSVPLKLSTAAFSMRDWMATQVESLRRAEEAMWDFEKAKRKREQKKEKETETETPDKPETKAKDSLRADDSDTDAKQEKILSVEKAKKEEEASHTPRTERVLEELKKIDPRVMRNYHLLRFNFPFGLAHLLADHPDSLLEGLFKLKADSLKTISVTHCNELKKAGKDPHAIGWQIQQNKEWVEEIKDRLQIQGGMQSPFFPYHLDVSNDASPWLGPDEFKTHEKLHPAEIGLKHLQCLQKSLNAGLKQDERLAKRLTGNTKKTTTKAKTRKK